MQVAVRPLRQQWLVLVELVQAQALQFLRRVAVELVVLLELLGLVELAELRELQSFLLVSVAVQGLV